MDLLQRIQQHFAESIEAKQAAVEVLSPAIAMAAEKIVQTLIADGKILVCGNGGSASDAQHFAAEMVGRFERERPGLPAIALTTDSSVLTAIADLLTGNDVSLCVPHPRTARIQEVHITAIHALCDAVDFTLLGGD